MLEKNLYEHLLTTISKDKWQRIGLKRRAGVLVPLFSIYSKRSLGVGDLEDLKLLIDWCNKTNLSIIQLLPMNELGSIFCPYDSISSFALEPVYIAIEKIPRVNKGFIKQKVEKLKKDFPVTKSYVDYHVKKEKLNILWEIFQEEDFRNSKELKNFQQENVYWINDFALFKVLKDYHQGNAWYDWEGDYKNRNKLALENFYRENEKEINFQIWLQMQLYKQFKNVKDYAIKKRVFIKGDLPILVSRDSADIWAHPEFFKLEFASGAPPDMYAALGQRWGMPTHNWQAIVQDNYKYVKEKLKYAENFYDILRIDHVVGLFRIWSISYNEPLENAGLNGSFDPKEEGKWEEHGRNLLEVLLNNTKMLLCAEDLGVIPQSCPKALWDFGIPGNDVERWVKDWKVKHDFLIPEDFRFLSVAMLSTHDTTNWPSWYEFEAGTVDEGLFIRKCSEKAIDFNLIKEKLFDMNFSRHGRLRWQDNISSIDILAHILGKRKEEAQDLIGIYENTYQEKEKLWKILGLQGPMREKCDKEIISAALNFTLKSKAIFCIELITDLLNLTDIFKEDSYEYRINTPGTISLNNWSLTMPIFLEELLRNKVNDAIKKMVIHHQRSGI